MSEPAEGNLDTGKPVRALDREEIESKREHADQDEADDLDPHASAGEQDECRDRKGDRGGCVRRWHRRQLYPAAWARRRESLPVRASLVVSV